MGVAYKNTIKTMAVLSMAIFSLMVHGQSDSTMVSNKKLVSIANELQDLRFSDSINAQILKEQEKQFTLMQVKAIQDSLTIDKLQSILNYNVGKAVEPIKELKWYQKPGFNFGLGCLTGAASIYFAAIVINKLK